MIDPVYEQTERLDDEDWDLSEDDVTDDICDHCAKPSVRCPNGAMPVGLKERMRYDQSTLTQTR